MRAKTAKRESLTYFLTIIVICVFLWIVKNEVSIVISFAAEDAKYSSSCAKNYPPSRLQDSSTSDMSRSSVWVQHNADLLTSSLTFMEGKVIRSF